MKTDELPEHILLEHFRAWPGVQLQDLIKLVYQQTFGSGHLLTDEQAGLGRLQDELASLSFCESYIPPLIEPIGDGLCRINLRQLHESGISLSTLNRMTVVSAAKKRGSASLFKAKLSHLAGLLAQGKLPFSRDELNRWIEQYDFADCPPLRHSDEFNRLCQPAYRILLREFADFLPCFEALDRRLRTGARCIAGIDGGCGSGKSTLAGLLMSVFDAGVIRMDHFFLPPELRTPARLAEAGGNVNYERFAAEVTPRLLCGQEFSYRPFDCQTMQFSQPVTVKPARLILIEGAYSFHPALNIEYDFKIFLEIDFAEQIRRIRQRNGEIMLERFLRDWIPMEQKYFNVWQIKENSDLIL